MAKQATCEERIQEHLDGRLENMAAYVAVANGEGTHKQQDLIDIDPSANAEEDAQERWGEYPLCVEVKRLLVVTLSTGGPADSFEVTLDEDGEPEAIEYVFQDWFDGARRSLRDREFDTAWAFLSWFNA